MQTLSRPASLGELHLSGRTQRRLQPDSSLTHVREGSRELQAPGYGVSGLCGSRQGQCSEFLSDKQKQVYHLTKWMVAWKFTCQKRCWAATSPPFPPRLGPAQLRAFVCCH